MVFVYLYYATILMLSTTQLSLISGWNFIYKVSQYVVLFAGVALVFGGRIKKNWFILSTSLVIISTVSALNNSKYLQLAIVMVFIIDGMYIRTENFDKVLNCYIKLATIVMVFTIIMSLTGIYYMDSRSGNRGITRYYLGFLAATHSPNYFLCIILAFAGKLRREINIKETITIMVINFILYKYTNTVAVFYYVIFVVVLLWVKRIYFKIYTDKFFHFLSTASFLMSSICIFFAAYYYSTNNKFLLALDAILSYRLLLANRAMNIYGITLFGSNIKWSTGRLGIERFTDYLYVDSAYINIALTYGIIILMFIIIAFSLLIYKSNKTGNVNFAIALTVLALHSFSDPQLFDLRYNPYLLFLSWAFVSNIRLNRGANSALRA